MTKDVDFCIGKEIKDISIPNQEKITIRIPIIAVEVKSYIDATMLGEVTNTSRKIKSAAPNSKSILLSFLKAFKEEHIYEVASESYIDDIILMTDNRRKSSKNTVELIDFTKIGLSDYYRVIEEYMQEVLGEEKVNSLGSLLSSRKGRG